MLRPQSNGEYLQDVSLDLRSAFITGREVLHVRSGGGIEVPAFTADIAFPLARIASDSVFATTTIDSASDFAIPVLCGAKGLNLFVRLTELNVTKVDAGTVMPLDGVTIACLVPSDAGVPTIPKSMLSAVPKGQCQLHASSGQRLTVQAGDYAVRIYAIGPVIS